MSRPVEYKIIVLELIFTLFGQSFTVPFEIHCPRCANRYTWRKERVDKKHSKKPPRYQCSKCKKRFYAHRSFLFRKIKVNEETGKEKEVIDRFDLFKDMFTTNKTLKTLTEQYGISTSRLSELKTWFLEQVRGKLDELQEAHGKKLPVNRDIIMIYLDGMVIRVQNTAFVLILAVDRKLNVLGFEFARKEEANAVERVFKRVLKSKGLAIKEFQNGNSNTPRLIVISDGHGCYRKMIRKNWLNCIHLAHVHKGDAQGLIIRLFRYQGKFEFETTMGTAIDVFKASGTSQIRVNTVKRRKLGEKGKKGRPPAPRTSPSQRYLHETSHLNQRRGDLKTTGRTGKAVFSMLMLKNVSWNSTNPLSFQKHWNTLPGCFMDNVSRPIQWKLSTACSGTCSGLPVLGLWNVQSCPCSLTCFSRRMSSTVPV